MRLTGPALALLLVAAAAAAGGSAFSPTLPDGVESVSGWEQVGGDFDTPGFRGGYLFYVNPLRQGLYQVMRYRTASDNAGTALGAERVAYVRRPGVREPILCWERQPAGSVPAWRPLEPGTTEYVAEMGTLIRVIAVHRAATLSGQP